MNTSNLNQYHQLLTTNSEQAMCAIKLIFEERTNDSINAQIIDWIELHPQSQEINQFIDKFSEFEEIYSLSEFLNPVCKISGWENNPVVREAAALGILIALVNCSWKLLGEKLKKEDTDIWQLDITSYEYKIITHIVKEADFSLLMDALRSACDNTTGEKYKQHFQSIVYKTDFSKRRQIDVIENERIKDTRGQVIILLICMYIFLDACYFLFKESLNTEAQQSQSGVHEYN